LFDSCEMDVALIFGGSIPQRIVWETIPQSRLSKCH
jgi:hypothetical protein